MKSNISSAANYLITVYIVWNEKEREHKINPCGAPKKTKQII